MFAVFLSIILLREFVVGERHMVGHVPKSRVSRRHVLEHPPLLLQLMVSTDNIGKLQDAGPEQTNISVMQQPCAGVADCPGAPCQLLPCQLAPTGTVVDQLAAAAEPWREHAEAMDEMATSDRRERLSAERRAEEAREAQTAAETAFHKEQMAAAVRSARASQAEEDRASADILAHEVLQNATQTAAWDAEQVVGAARIQQALEAQRSIGDAAEVAAETFVNGTAHYVDHAVKAGNAQASAEELRAKAMDSGAQAESYKMQAERDEAAALEASQGFDDLQRTAQESAARAASLKAHAAEVARESIQAEWSLQQKDQLVFDAREVTSSFRETAIEDLRRAAGEAVKDIESTSSQSMTHVENIRDQVSREQVMVVAEAKQRASQTMAHIFPNARDFQVQNVLPLEIPQVSQQ